MGHKRDLEQINAARHKASASAANATIEAHCLELSRAMYKQLEDMSF
jgi:hypothetical protein